MFVIVDVTIGVSLFSDWMCAIQGLRKSVIAKEKKRTVVFDYKDITELK